MMNRLLVAALLALAIFVGEGVLAADSIIGSARVIDGDSAPRPARKGGRNVEKAAFEQLCCTRDEGRPLGLGLQDQGPNHRGLLRHNGWGGERSRKRRNNRQVSAGKTNASEPLKTYRNRCQDVVETRRVLPAWDKARRKPADWPGGNRYGGGVIPVQALVRNVGTCAPL